MSDRSDERYYLTMPPDDAIDMLQSIVSKVFDGKPLSKAEIDFVKNTRKVTSLIDSRGGFTKVMDNHLRSTSAGVRWTKEMTEDLIYTSEIFHKYTARTNYKKKFYAFLCGLSGQPDATIATEIMVVSGEECVMMILPVCVYEILVGSKKSHTKNILSYLSKVCSFDYISSVCKVENMITFIDNLDTIEIDMENVIAAFEPISKDIRPFKLELE